MQPKTLVLNKIPIIRPQAKSDPVKTELGDYEVAQFSGRNESGFQPIGDHVLIMPDQAFDSGVIKLPDDVLEKIALAAVTGVIVALGDGAFFWNSDRTRPYEGEKPKVGQRIYFERYAGQKAFGRDRKWYRCLADKCIACVCVD